MRTIKGNEEKNDRRPFSFRGCYCNCQAAQATSSDRQTPLFSSMNSNCETNHRGVSSF